MEWSPQQLEAIADFRSWYTRAPWRQDARQGVYYLAGYAGTGKTALAQELAAWMEGQGHVVFCAYTGKAALVLRQRGCSTAQTIHSVIYNVGGEAPEDAKVTAIRDEIAALSKHFNRDTEQPNPESSTEDVAHAIRRLPELHAELARASGGRKNKNRVLFSKRTMDESPLKGAAGAVVDECSMAGRKIADDMKSFGVPILALGDPAQLPPVGDGGGFTDQEPNYTLTEIHRQAKGSGILQFATAVRQGDVPYLETDDCRVLQHDRTTPEQRQAMIMAADQVIVGRNATRRAYNHRIRELMGLGGGIPHPVPGDRLICLRNDHQVGVLNGSQWRCEAAEVAGDTVALGITPLDFPGGRIDVVAHIAHFEGREDTLAPYQIKGLQLFTFGYAITCHKSQGSQWGKVFVKDESASFKQDWWRHLYTAATRAQKDLTVIR